MKLVCSFVLSIVCSVSWAAWEETYRNGPEQYTVYHDKSTKIGDGRIVKIWVLYDFDNFYLTESKKKYRSEKRLRVYDCLSEVTATILLSMHSQNMGMGKVVFKSAKKEKNLEWEPVLFNTLGELEWKAACLNEVVPKQDLGCLKFGKYGLDFSDCK